KNPFGKQHHNNALAAALRMPNDAALISIDTFLSLLDAKILVHPRELLHATVEEHKIVQQLDEPLLAAHLEQILVELEAGVVRLVFLPLEEIFLFRADGPVAQPLRIIASEDDLHGVEKPLIELGLLIGEQLPDAIANGNAAALKFNHSHCYAVDVEHEVGTAFITASQGDFLRNGEVILLRLFPIDKLDRIGDLAGFDLHRNAVP